VIDAISVVFFAVVYLAIAETYRPQKPISLLSRKQLGNSTARSPSLVCVLVNIIYTTYISQLHSLFCRSTSSFVPVEIPEKGLPNQPSVRCSASLL